MRTIATLISDIREYRNASRAQRAISTRMRRRGITHETGAWRSANARTDAAIKRLPWVAR